MALFGVGKNRYEILCQSKDGKVRTIVVPGDVTITRSPNQPSCMKFKVRRNYEGAYTPENGDIVTFTVDEQHDMFWGYVVHTSKEELNVDITCYDQLWYLNQNTYSKSFGTISASDLYIKMAEEFGFNMTDPPNVENTVYAIPNVIMDNAKPIDVMTDALNITFEHTGFRYYIYDAFNNLCLARGEQPDTLKVNTLCINHYNCKSYKYDEDIEDTYNVIKVHRKTNDKEEVVEAINQRSADWYGRLEYSVTAGEGEDMQKIADELLEEKQSVNISMNCTDVIGDPRVFGGSCVFVDLYTNGLNDRREYIRGWFKVDSVTHKFENATHYMDLDLSLLWMYDDWEYQGINPEYNYEKYGKDTSLW